MKSLNKKRILLVVDLQEEFYEKSGNFERILNFVKTTKDYDKIYATRCGNSYDSSFYKYHNWSACLHGVAPLPFNPDKIIDKTSYGLPDYRVLSKENHYDIIGYNTDACVLKIALDLFDKGYDFNVLTKYCYSSTSREQHISGVKLLKHLMSDAII